MVKEIAESLVGETRVLNGNGKWISQGETSAFFLAAEYGNEEWAKKTEGQNVNTAEAIADLLVPAKLR